MFNQAIHRHLVQKLLILSLLVWAPLVHAAQETRDLPAFNGIKSQGVYKLRVTAGQARSVVVNGEEGQLAQLSTTVVGDDLVITMPEKKSHSWNERVTITITLPELTRLHIQGLGDTSLNDLVGESFELKYQGVGTLTAKGTVNRLVLKAEGVGRINAKDLTAREVDARLEGLGSVKVRATETLTARVEGLGSLTYFGRPKQVTKSAEGLGSVRAGD